MRHFAILMVFCAALACVPAQLCAEDYLIKPGDSLGVTVLGEPELTKRVVVGPQGGITLPLIGEVNAAGLTTGQAAEEITRRFDRFLKNPQVSVELLEPAKMQVTVSGEVRSPGIYPIVGGARLMDAITAAGGCTPAADMSRITISRVGASGPAAVVDLGEFLLSGDPSANVLISSGDTILVPTGATMVVGVVTVLGAVRQPGQHSITQGMTAREVIMLAGGPTELADMRNITLRREGSAGAVPLDYAGGAAADPEMKPGDVIYVPAHVELGYYTIQGAVGRPGRYELRGATSITEAIAIAGGVGDRAKLHDVRILRTSGGKPETLRANVSDIMAGKAQNIPIRGDDDIFVPAGKQGPDYLRILSLAVSLGWLLTRR